MTTPLRYLLRLLLVLLLLLVVFVALLVSVLARGVTRDAVSLGGVQVEHLDIRLDHKLVLDIGRVRVDRTPAAQPSQRADLSSVLNPTRVRELLHGIYWLARLFRRIDIGHIEAGEIEGSFRYREGDVGHLQAQGAGLDIQLDLDFDGEQLVVDIARLQAPAWGVRATGQLFLDPLERQLRARVEGVLADTLPLHLSLQADREQVTFQGHGLKPVTTIAPIVELFNLGPRINPWILDYLHGERFTLHELSGSMSYRDPARILQTLRVRAHAEEVAYTFAQGLEPVRAQSADLVFEQGVLHIVPHDAIFYGQDGGSSTVDLDFNDHRFQVRVYVRTHARFNAGIRGVLSHYGVRLPFEQVAGLIDTDLTLVIDVAPVAVHTKGQFVSTDSEVQLGAQRYQVAAMDIGLQDAQIDIKQLELGLGGRFSGSIAGRFDAATQQGMLGIVLEQVNWPLHGGAALVLQPSPAQPARFTYHFRPQGDTIAVPATAWRFGKLSFSVAPFTTEFNRSTVSGEVDHVGVSVDGWMQAAVSGRYSKTSPFADLDVVLDSFDKAGVKLAKPGALVSVRVAEAVEVSTSNELPFSVKGMPVLLQPTRLHFSSGVLRLDSGGVRGDELSAGLRGQWRIASRSGELVLEDASIRDRAGKTLFSASGALPLHLGLGAHGLHLKSDDMALGFEQLANGGWKLHSSDLGALQRNVPLLQRFGIEGGHVNLSTRDHSAPLAVDGLLRLTDPLLVQGNTPLHDYRVKGSYRDKITRLSINELMQVEFAGGLRINSRELGFNMPALMALGQRVSSTVESQARDTHDAVDDKRTAAGGAPSGKGSGGMRVLLRASDSFLWLDDKRRAPAQHLMAHYADGEVTGDLQHRIGYAKLEWVDNYLHVEGKNFDDSFFGELMHIADLAGGTMEFKAKGSAEGLTAGLRIKHTELRNFKHLDNILAFIDTVPALVTFSVPHYNSRGLPIEELYVKVDYQNKVVELESLHINSNELMVNGAGTLDFAQGTTDMTFNVLTGAKKNIHRIPLLGYVLAGDENRPSITLTLSGDLHNPEVHQSAFKQVVTYPYELIKRTVLLPKHLADKARKTPPPDGS